MLGHRIVTILCPFTPPLLGDKGDTVYDYDIIGVKVVSSQFSKRMPITLGLYPERTIPLQPCLNWYGIRRKRAVILSLHHPCPPDAGCPINGRNLEDMVGRNQFGWLEGTRQVLPWITRGTLCQSHGIWPSSHGSYTPFPKAISALSLRLWWHLGRAFVKRKPSPARGASTSTIAVHAMVRPVYQWSGTRQVTLMVGLLIYTLPCPLHP